MLEKATIVVKETQQKIPVMYNPTELSDNRSVEVCGEGANLQFIRAKRDDLNVSLFFDTYAKGSDVRKETGKIMALMKPTEGKGNRKEPPVVMFSWSDVWFTGIITQLTQKYTMFLPSGVPVRARLEVNFQSVFTEKQELESLGLYNCRKLVMVTQSDRLDLLAYKETGDPAFWRQIATENDLENPLSFPLGGQTGKVLVIPDNHAGRTEP